MIPQVARLIWLGSELPPAYVRELDHFRGLNPDWVVEVWGEDRIRDFGLANRAVFDQAHTLVPEDSVYQLQSDIARYEILLRHGGVYVDADYRWQKPLANLELDDRLTTCWERQGRFVANGFIASRPGNPLLRRAVRDVPIWCQRWGRRELRANRLTGPGGLWTDLIRRNRQRVRVLDQAVLHPVPWSHPEWAEDFEFPDSVAIHLWGHQTSMKEER